MRRKLIPVIFATFTSENIKLSDVGKDLVKKGWGWEDLQRTRLEDILSSNGDLLCGESGVSEFIKDLLFHTKTHIYDLNGWELSENIHAHSTLFVPEDEADRFHLKLTTFDPWKHWRFRTIDFQDWDYSKAKTKSGAFGYTGGKHRPWTTGLKCPRVYSRCRNGKCDLFGAIPSEVERFAHHNPGW